MPSPSPGNSTSSIVQAPATAGVSSSSFHKQKPKPHGKHHRLATQLTSEPPATADDPDNQSNTNKSKSEFVTKNTELLNVKRLEKSPVQCVSMEHTVKLRQTNITVFLILQLSAASSLRYLTIRVPLDGISTAIKIGVSHVGTVERTSHLKVI